ncbi:membrane protein insertion efficiency factor YidD [Herbiconiux sp. P15]|uniref:membrane protein insertion efficiency factor YidD n=1 Tax=Herbiconiux liukaitaii TaxID=3342799 RepID=UPI0035B9BE64
MPAWVVMVLLVPRNIAVVLLRGYRAVISPLYGDVCRYYPSCSSYTLQAIQQRGLVVGTGLGIYRIARCHPWAKGGVDDPPRPRRQKYRLTPFGFVIPASSHGKG